MRLSSVGSWEFEDFFTRPVPSGNAGSSDPSSSQVKKGHTYADAVSVTSAISIVRMLSSSADSSVVSV